MGACLAFLFEAFAQLIAEKLDQIIEDRAPTPQPGAIQNAQGMKYVFSADSISANINFLNTKKTHFLQI